MNLVAEAEHEEFPQFRVQNGCKHQGFALGPISAPVSPTLYLDKFGHRARGWLGGGWILPVVLKGT